MCLFLCFHVSVFLYFLQDTSNSKSNGSRNMNRSRNMKLEHFTVYENISDKFDIGHCWAKVKVMARL